MIEMYRAYNVTTGEHGTSYEEWSPHKAQTEKTFEWWYLTNILDDENGNKLFQHLILLHSAGSNYLQLWGFDRNSGPGLYSCSFALSDYSRKLRISEVALSKMEHAYTPDNNTMKFSANGFIMSWAYLGAKMAIWGKTARQQIELELEDTKGVLWHRDKLGINGMIAESAPDEPSFYYSIPTLNVNGLLSYTDDHGKKITTRVTGEGWCDRQWGDYMTKSWEWCSMRFFDGDRVNLYAFPQTGHKVGSYMTCSGNAEFFDNFNVYQKNYFEACDGTWLTSEWDYEIPIKNKKYHVVAVSKDDVFVSPGNTLFEGMGLIYDEKEELVGLTANESMDLRATLTGPYKNKF